MPNILLNLWIISINLPPLLITYSHKKLKFFIENITTINPQYVLLLNKYYLSQKYFINQVRHPRGSLIVKTKY